MEIRRNAIDNFSLNDSSVAVSWQPVELNFRHAAYDGHPFLPADMFIRKTTVEMKLA